MKKAYTKSGLDPVCFELSEDILAASGGAKDLPDCAGGAFEKAAGRILNLLSNTGD